MNYSKLSFAPEDYNPIVLKGKYTERELRQEYTRLRDIAVKRLKRLGQSEFSTSKSYTENVGRITPKLSTIGSASELARRLTDLARFVSSETSSVSGLRSKRGKAINALHDAGYDFVDASNLDDFIDFMDYNRSLKRGGLYDSDRVAELFADAEKKKIRAADVLKDFDFYMQNIKKLEDTPTKKGAGSAYYKKAIAGKRKKK